MHDGINNVHTAFSGPRIYLLPSSTDMLKEGGMDGCLTTLNLFKKMFGLDLNTVVFETFVFIWHHPKYKIQHPSGEII